MFAYVLAVARGLIHNDSAQDAFEYLLVIGGVSVLVIAAMVTPVGDAMIDAVIGGVCTAINKVMDPDISCTFS